MVWSSPEIRAVDPTHCSSGAIRLLLGALVMFQHFAPILHLVGGVHSGTLPYTGNRTAHAMTHSACHAGIDPLVNHYRDKVRVRRVVGFV